MWVQFAPDSAVADSDTWALSKLGSLVSPLDVLRNGSHSMHGVDDDGVAVNGLGYRHSWERLRIRCTTPPLQKHQHELWYFLAAWR